MRAGLYCRVSTQDQAADDRTSIDDQLRRGHETCARHGWAVVDSYIESISGESFDERPQVRRMLDDAETGRIDAIVVSRLDRLARGDLAFAQIFDRLDRAEVAVVVDGRIYEPDNLDSLLTRGISSVVASHDKKALVRRMAGAAYATARAGGWPAGTVPFGYRLRWPHDGTGRRTGKAVVEINDDEAATLRTIVRLILDGHSTGAVCRQLNSRGLQPRKAARWEPRRLHKLLRDRKITGLVVYGKPTETSTRTPSQRRGRTKLRKDGSPRYGQPVEIQLPEIISITQYEEVQRQLDRRARGPQTPRKGRTYALSGATSLCGRTLIGHYQSKIARRQYRCSGSKIPENRCGCSLIDANLLEARVWRRLIEFLSDAERTEAVAERFTSASARNRADDEQALADVERKIEVKRHEQDDTLDKLIEQGVPTDVVARRQQRLAAELTEPDGTRTELQARMAATETDAELAETLTGVAAQAAQLAEADPHRQATIYSDLAVRVELTEDGSVPGFVLTGRLPTGGSWFTGSPAGMSDEPAPTVRGGQGCQPSPTRTRRAQPASLITP